MKSKLVVSLLVITVMLCPAFAFAADATEPVIVDETVVVAEDADTGEVVAEAVEVDTLTPMSEKEIKAEAKEEIKEVMEEAKEEVEEIKAEENEALKEAKM